MKILYVIFLSICIGISVYAQNISSDTVCGFFISNVRGTMKNNAETFAHLELVENGLKGKALKVRLNLKRWGDEGQIEEITISKKYPLTKTPSSPYFGLLRKVISCSDPGCEFFCQITLLKNPSTEEDTVFYNSVMWSAYHYVDNVGWISRLQFTPRKDWYFFEKRNPQFNQVNFSFLVNSKISRFVEIEFILDDLQYCGGVYWDGFSYDSLGQVFKMDTLTAYNVIFETFGDRDIPLSVKQVSQGVPSCVFLSQNFPNPFNPSTKIQFSLNQTEYISLVVYDVMGREVEKIFSGILRPGIYEYVWNGHVSSGMYFYQLKTSSHILTRKMILMK